jgi:hypothetical protein
MLALRRGANPVLNHSLCLTAKAALELPDYAGVDKGLPGFDLGRFIRLVYPLCYHRCFKYTHNFFVFQF